MLRLPRLVPRAPDKRETACTALVDLEGSLDTATRIVGAADRELTSDATGFYESYWREGERVADETTARQRDLVRALFPEPPAGKRVLELGVGAEGGVISQIAQANEVFGLDASPVAVASCERMGIPAQRFNADRDAVPFADDHFDIVFSFEVCEHMANPQFALEEIRRVLKPGGRFVASTPNPLVHHWPRYFYPQLIEHDAFRDFLLVNKLWVHRTLGLSNHWYRNIVPAAHQKVWSWVWDCENARSRADLLLETGRTFWARTDEHGIRSRPIEASDLARAALQLEPGNVAARGLLTAALVYRMINGETAELLANASSLAATASAAGDEGVEARFWLCAAEIEATKFERHLLNESDFERLFHEVSSARPDLAAELTDLLQATLALAGRL